MKRLNHDCSQIGGLEAVLQVAVGAHVMLRRNIDTSKGLVNEAVGTVISIKVHCIAVQFDNVPKAYQVEKVKSKHEKINVFRKQFPLICSHNTQVPGSVSRLWYDGTVRSGIQYRYGVRCIIPS